jgi:hypothetical protein
MRRPTTTLPPTPTRHATSKPSKKRAVKKTRPEPRAVLKETPADRAECELPRRDAARSSVRDRVPRSYVCGTRSAAVGSCHSVCSRSSAPARCRRSRRSTRPNKRSPRRAAPRGGTPGAHSRTRLVGRRFPDRLRRRASELQRGEMPTKATSPVLRSTVTLISGCTQPQFVRLKVSPKPVPRSHSLLSPGGEASRSPGSKPGRTAAYGRRRRWPPPFKGGALRFLSRQPTTAHLRAVNVFQRAL